MINKHSYISSPINTGAEKMKQQRAEERAVKRAAQAEPEQSPNITVGNVKKYITAEMSLQLYGPVTDKTLAERKAACMGCDARFDSKEVADSIGFCRSCGCGVTARSRLSVKLTMPEATCPKKLWSPAGGSHSTIKDKVKSWLLKRIIG